MNWRVLGSQQSHWHECLDRFAQSDVYFLPEYHRAYELDGVATARAFVAEEEHHLFFYPFMMRPIEQVGSEPVDGPWADIESVYGYSGPLCTTADRGFLERAWALFASWCRQNRIVAEFVKFNPLLANHCCADGAVTATLERETVAIRLDCSAGDLWAGYPSGHRNTVRKAQRSGLHAEEPSLREGLDVFRELYLATMDRVAAARAYYFSADYFDHLRTQLADQVRIFTVGRDGRAMAAGLFLVHGDRLHYHLGGSATDGRTSGATNLLLHTVAAWGQEHGYRWLHLGGGRSPDPDDSLFRFKASLSRSRLAFFVGQRVHNPPVYDRLCSQWMRQTASATRPGYFLLYRLEPAG